MQSDTGFKNPPENLISEQGQISYGNFIGPIAKLNWRDFDYTKLKRFPWTVCPSLAEKLFKRWQFAGIIDPDFAVGAAIAHVNYLSSGFFYVYDRSSGSLAEFNFKQPFGVQTQFSDTPACGITRIKKGTGFIEFDNTSDGSSLCRLTIEIPGKTRAKLEIFGESNGVSTICPQNKNGFHYTYKCAGLKARGSFELNGKRHEFSQEAMALFDWTASTPPHLTSWNWSAAVGKDTEGRNIGINLSRGLVGGNYSQNSVWVDGKPHMLSQADFEYDPLRMLETEWRVRTSDSRLDLRFRPQCERKENINMWLISSRFRQPFGEFRGIIKLPEESFEVELFGVCEEHLAKW